MGSVLGTFMIVSLVLQVFMVMGGSANKMGSAYLPYNDSADYSGMQNTTVVTPIVSIAVFLMSLIYFFVVMWFSASSILAVIKTYRGDLVPVKDLMLLGLKKTFKFILLTFLLFTIVGLGSLLLIVPGIVLGIKYMYAQFIFLGEDVGVFEAMKKSADITKGYKMNLFLKMIGFFFVALLSLVPMIMIAYALGIMGSLILNGVFAITVLVIMDDIKGLKTSAVQAEPVLPAPAPTLAPAVPPLGDFPQTTTIA